LIEAALLLGGWFEGLEAEMGGDGKVFKVSYKKGDLRVLLHMGNGLSDEYGAVRVRNDDARLIGMASGCMQNIDRPSSKHVGISMRPGLRY
jgi:hypothetical protein